MYAERTQREDIVHFLNSAYACTGQSEFYENEHAQRVSIDFLHEYMLINYRSIYVRALALGINHFNQGQIILRLLATGRQALPEEGRLIAQAISGMPPQRVWKLFSDLRTRKINNRRSRAIVRDYMKTRDLTFDCVKYRNKVKTVISHVHAKLPGEAGLFLYDRGTKSFETSLFETVRRARYSKDAVYDLPYTVAEGFAEKHGIPREVFLRRIEPRMTQAEKLRLQKTSEVKIDLTRSPLTKLALYFLGQREYLPVWDEALSTAARRLLVRLPLRLGRVAAVLDNSYSASGSQEKRRRPLGIAWAIDRILAHASSSYQSFWTFPFEGPKPSARGGTDLATPVLKALEDTPDLIVIVSDAIENDPPGAAGAVLSAWRKFLDPNARTCIVHVNPVFSAHEYAPRSLCADVPTVGIRDAESLPTALMFAQFANQQVSRPQLEEFLDCRVEEFLRAG